MRRTYPHATHVHNHFQAARCQRDPIPKRGSTALMEAAEPRLLAAVSESWESSVMSEITGYALLAEVLFGDNGNPYGADGITLSNETEYQGDVVTWDSDLSDGIDSGWIGVELSAGAGTAGSQWCVDGIGSLELGSAGIDNIGKVTVRAAVAGGGLAMRWQDLRVQFYSDGQLVDSLNLGDGPCADTLAISNSTPVESGVHIIPSTADVDQVVVMGMVRLQAAAGVTPGVTDIFSQVLITEAS